MSSTSNMEADNPTFPLTNPSDIEEAQIIETTPEEAEATKPSDQTHTERKEVRSQRFASNRAERIASDDPGDTYEEWRLTLFKSGIHKLRMWYREPDSKTFVNPPQPYQDVMVSFEDLCAAHSKGAIIRVQMYKPNAHGKMTSCSPPLEIAIAPKGDYQVSGYGNPFSNAGMSGQQPYFNFKDMLSWSDQQSEKREKQQKEAMDMQNTNSNNWLQLALSNQNKNNGQPDQTMVMLQQMNNQTMQMMTNIFAQMSQQQQSNTQILIAALDKKGGGDDNMLALYKMQSEQNNILLQNALKGGDLKEQVALLHSLSEFTEPTAIGEIAKLAEAINLGGNLENVTGALANKIDGSNKKKENAPPPPIPDPVDQTTPAQTTAPQQAQEQQEPPPAQTAPAVNNPKDSGFYELLQLVKTSYISGHTAPELAEAIHTGNPAIAAQIATYPQDFLLEKLQEHASNFGVSELVTTAGTQFVIDFLQEIKAKGTVTNDTTPAPTPDPGN